MLFVQLIEASLTLKAVQGYRSFDGLLFWHQHKRASIAKPSFAYRRTSTDTDSVPLIEARTKRASSYSSSYNDKHLSSPETKRMLSSPRKSGEDFQFTEEPEEGLVLPDHDEDLHNVPTLGYHDPFHDV